MSGGILQLVAYGIEDLILTGEPQISLFKWVYKRHTNFIKKNHIIDNQTTLQFGQRYIVPLKLGDIIESIWLEITLPQLTKANSKFAWVNYPACALIESATIRVEDNILYEITGEWIYINELLAGKQEHLAGWKTMVGQINELITFQKIQKSHKCNIKLPFWREVANGLPLVSLWGQHVTLEIKFQPIEKILFESDWNPSQSTYIISRPTLLNFNVKPTLHVKVNLELIYLDDYEKKFFQNREHHCWNQIINMEEHDSDLSYVQNEIQFSRPLVELVWCFLPSEALQTFDYTKNIQTIQNSNSDTVLPTFVKSEYKGNISSQVEILFQETSIASKRISNYFTETQPYQYHSNIPYDSGIHSYSFALFPESSMPSGHLSSGTIQLYQELDFFNGNLTTTNHTLRIYKVSLNRFTYSKGSCKILFP